MITFRENYYADVRIEDRSRTVIQYQDGKLQEFKTPVEVRASSASRQRSPKGWRSAKRRAPNAR